MQTYEEKVCEDMAILHDEVVQDAEVDSLVETLVAHGGSAPVLELLAEASGRGTPKRQFMASVDRGLAYGRIGARNMLAELYVVQQ